MRKFVAVIVIGFFASAHAGVLGTYGSWSYTHFTNQTDRWSAITLNDSGASLAKFCYPGLGYCRWEFAAPISCKNGSATPVLISSPAGALASTLICSGNTFQEGRNTLYEEYFNNPDDIDKAVMKGVGMFAVAFALNDGSFESQRFNLQGALNALSAMYKSMPPIQKTPGQSTDGAGGGQF